MKYYSYILKLVVCFCLSLFANSMAQANDINSIQFQSILDLDYQYHPKEFQALNEEVYQKYNVIDLKKSQLPSLSQWLNTLNSRLNEAVEKQGSALSTYKIGILASEQPEAFIYKFIIPGSNGQYRGHVFFSTGLIHKFCDTLQLDLSKATKQDIAILLTGLQGVIAHEFFHPKQDEVVKWNWRKVHETYGPNHTQMDELATDIMATNGLKEAKLDVDSVLKGLLLVFGKPTDKHQNFIQRALETAIAVHPQNELRLNLMRGVLTHIRMTKGLGTVKPITFEADKMQLELQKLITANDFLTQVYTRYANDLNVKGSKFAALLEAMSEEFAEAPYFTDKLRKKISKYLRVLIQLDRKISKYSNFEKESFLSFIKFVYTPKRIMKIAYNRMMTPTKDWTSNSRSSKDILIPPSFSQLTTFRHFISAHSLYQDPYIQKGLQTIIAKKRNLFLGENKDHPDIHILGSIGILLPKNLVEAEYEHMLKRIDNMPQKEKLEYLVSMWIGLISINGSPILEAKIVDILKQEIIHGSGARESFNVLFNIGSYFRKLDIFSSRILASEIPNQKSPLLESYYNLSLEILKNPSWEWVQAFKYPHGSASFFWQSILWHKDPRNRFLKFANNSHFYLENLVDELISIINSPNWSKEIKKIVSQSKENNTFLYPLENLSMFFALFDHSKALGKRRNIANKIQDSILFHPTFLKLGLELPEVQKAQIYILSKSSIWENTKIVNKWFGLLAQKIGKEKALDVLHKNSYILKKNQNRHESTKNQILLDIYIGLYRDKLIDFKDINDFFQYKWLKTHNNEPKIELIELRTKTFRSMIQIYVENSYDFEALVKMILSSLDISHFDIRNTTNMKLSKESYAELKNAKLAKLQFHPDYGKVLEKLTPLLFSKFLKALNITKADFADVKKLSNIWKKDFDTATHLLSLVFNPDNKVSPPQLRQSLKFRGLPSLTYHFINAIPKEGLSTVQYFTIWEILTKKTQSRYTDQILLEQFYKSKNNIRTLYQFISPTEALLQNRFKSEELKVYALRSALEKNIKKLANQIANQKNPIKDIQIANLADDVIRLVPTSSHFKDKFLEDISWSLQLNKKQIQKFIEPYKSFNFKRIDIQTLNLLSVMTEMIYLLKNHEKLALIKYIRKPLGALESTVPRLRKIEPQLLKVLPYEQAKKIESLITNIETAIQDSSHVERTILIETLVGTRKHGLWFQGEKWQNHILKLLDVEKKNSEERLAFEHYIRSGAPSWELSNTISYMLASTENSKEKSRIREILEYFKAPGEKFAQLASTLSIFGEQYNEDLAKTKNQASPPTRLEVLEDVSELFPKTSKNPAKNVIRLLGSGSIKYVILVEFEDGQRVALSVKKKNLEATIASTMDIIENWSKAMANDPLLKENYDFEFYIKSLRKQLTNETDLSVEAENYKNMRRIYSKFSYKSWKMEVPKVLNEFMKNERVISTFAVENAVQFDQLSETDRKTVSKLILNAELNLLFEKGIFDADRHIGNYLFDPIAKKIYIIDVGQVYKLKNHGLFKKGDAYHISRLLEEINKKGKENSVKEVIKILLKFHTGPNWKGNKTALADDIKKVLTNNVNSNKDMTKILAIVNRHKIHLPLGISLGVIKGLSLLLNEEYAKELGRDNVIQLLKRYASKAQLKAAPLESAIKALSGNVLKCRNVLK